jgi:DNA-binding NtrC family response regulator
MANRKIRQRGDGAQIQYINSHGQLFSLAAAVLEEWEIYRMGENTPRKVSLRLHAATHRDLRADVADGKLRMDLYYRLAVTNISIPPLRERKTDFPEMIEHWLRVSREMRDPGVTRRVSR